MTDRRIITVTLDPVLVRTITARYFAAGYANRAEGTSQVSADGGGVNVSRALQRLGQPTHALVLGADDPLGCAYEAALQREAMPLTVVTASAQTGSRISIYDPGNEQETIIIEEGAALPLEAAANVQAALLELVTPGDIVVFAGSIPLGSPLDLYSTLIAAAHRADCLVVVALETPALPEAVAARPDLVALSRLQAESFFNFPVRTTEGVIQAARQLADRGIERVLVEVNPAAEAVLIAADEVYLAEWPQASAEQQVTRAGVWEALLSGYLAGRAEDQSFADSLTLGLAAAAYTARQVGSKFPALGELETLRHEIAVRQLSSGAEKADDVPTQ